MLLEEGFSVRLCITDTLNILNELNI